MNKPIHKHDRDTDEFITNLECGGHIGDLYLAWSSLTSEYSVIWRHSSNGPDYTSYPLDTAMLERVYYADEGIYAISAHKLAMYTLASSYLLKVQNEQSS